MYGLCCFDCSLMFVHTIAPIDAERLLLITTNYISSIRFVHCLGNWETVTHWSITEHVMPVDLFDWIAYHRTIATKMQSEIWYTYLCLWWTVMYDRCDHSTQSRFCGRCIASWKTHSNSTKYVQQTPNWTALLSAIVAACSENAPITPKQHTSFSAHTSNGDEKHKLAGRTNERPTHSHRMLLRRFFFSFYGDRMSVG